ncbi:hypothetical protein CBM2586_B90251 [Cupriavidus phytorum]|uniref:Uncharacterized protein n=1 Tax=Cupriavidus taiwanensis TaxID=164546 RepID=A0A976FS63_9BURK|nr:hypothetical protein CBM2586_B90251 [Cupriavidus taiwanensis]
MVFARLQPGAGCRRRLQRGLDRRCIGIGSHRGGQLTQRGLRRFQAIAQLVQQLVLRIAGVGAVGGHQRILERVDAAQVHHASQHQAHRFRGAGQVAGSQLGLRGGIELVEEGGGAALCQRRSHQFGQRRDVGHGGGTGAGLDHRMQRGAIRRLDAEHARARRAIDAECEAPVRGGGGRAAPRGAFGLDRGTAQRRAHGCSAGDFCGSGRRGGRRISAAASTGRQYGRRQTRQKQMFCFHPCIDFCDFCYGRALRGGTLAQCMTPPTERLTRPAGAIFREMPDGAQPALR